jgi:hypothetical protein
MYWETVWDFENKASLVKILCAASRSTQFAVLFPRYWNWFWVSPILVAMGYRVSFPEVEWKGLEANHPPQSSSEVKIAQSYTSLHHASSKHGA